MMIFILILYSIWHLSLFPITLCFNGRIMIECSFHVLLCIFTRAVKRLKYLIVINRINVIVNSRLIAINHKLFFYAKYPLIFMSHNSSHFNYLINMVKCIGLPCANDFLLITTLAYTRAVTIRVSNRKSRYSKPRSCLAVWEGRSAIRPF